MRRDAAGNGRAVIRRRQLLVGALGAAASAAACAKKRPVAEPPPRLRENTGAFFSAPEASPTAVATASGPALVANSSSAPAAQASDGNPDFAEVAQAGPEESVQFLAGRHPRYPGASVANFLGFSPADILETMDTVVLDQVGDRFGDGALRIIYGLIARNLLDSLVSIYPGRSVLLALDAGHGGKPGVYFEPGSNGTEAEHNRRVVAVIEQTALDARYRAVTIRRIFNDEIGDDFGLPPPEDRKDRASLVLRNVRGAMLAFEADAWNRAHPEAQVVTHLLSVHFNANSKGTLVLHQGADVPSVHQQRSLAFARVYVQMARPALNASGLLPYELGLVAEGGLHDDALMYTYTPSARSRPNPINPFTGVDRSHFPPRYAMLQASLLEDDYVRGLLVYRGLA